jgi:hypothetical protein
MADPLVPVSDYHSAHGVYLDHEPVQRFQIGPSVAFQHDLATGLPEHYQFCDVLYCDPPWANGFDEFNRRAGVDDGRTYRQFMGAMAGALETVTQPAFIVTGRHALKMLPKPAQVVPIQLNQYASVAIVYNTEISSTPGTATELLRLLAQSYDSVGDFCCGYGRTLKAFHRQGKPFVGSDINAGCIGYIAMHAPDWRRDV